MVDWNKLPDLGAVAFLAIAFAAVAKRNKTAVSGLWVTGWILIACHCSALLFAPAARSAGDIARFLAFLALAWAGIIFMLAAVPYRDQSSTRWMLSLLLSTYGLYICLLIFAPDATWALIPAALLLGAAPLTITVLNLGSLNHPLRWSLSFLNLALAFFLVAFQQRPGNGTDLALSAILFSVYFSCCLHFWYSYRKPTAGALITTAGFLSWASVFALVPAIAAIVPSVHLEDQVWSLPKYIVAIGMILLILEEQIESNKHLALHDDLTGLPNRRLFQDRLSTTLDRARRSGSGAALLLIDLDRFKQVNDTVGHHAGDIVLKRASQIFKERVRRSDTVARTGGDEFSIILEEPTGREDAQRVARSLVELLNQPLHVDGHIVHVGASVGIAIFPEDAATAEALQIAADHRMYQQKHQSRETEATFPGMSPQAEELASLPARNKAPGFHPGLQGKKEALR